MSLSKNFTGSYLLLIWIGQKRLNYARKSVAIKPGLYVYVGSGMRGLLSRLKRHFETTKKLKWHIDYVTTKFQTLGAFVMESNIRLESFLAQELLKRYKYVPKFGSTDTKNESHLFYIGDKPSDALLFFKVILSIFESKRSCIKALYWYCNNILSKINV